MPQSINPGKVWDSDSIGQSQFNFPAGFVRTSDEPHQMFYDPFDAALDTANTWATPTVGNAAVLAAVSAGVLSMGTGTTASGWSKLGSIGTFKPTVPAWLGFSFAINLPDGAAPTANAYRFWGAGTIPGVPTTAVPLTDAIGFELTTAGKLQAVVYAAGVRTLIADLSSTGTNTQPLDALSHRYIVYVRTDKAFFYIDSLATPVATSNFQAPAVQTLPLSLLAVGGATPPVSNTQIQCSGLAVWDTGKNATQLADGTYPWRKAQVSAAGALTISSADGGQTTIGTTTDVEASAGNGTLVALFKRIRTLLNGGLPAALAASGGLKVEGVAGGVALPVSGTVATTTADGSLTSLGALADAEVTGAGSASAIAVLKRLRTLLNGGLPAALAASGGLKVEGVAGGVVVPVSGTVTGGQGTAAALSAAWPAKVTDGTTATAVKAASTAPVAADPAMVVALSPNATLPEVRAATTMATNTGVSAAAVTLTLAAAGAGLFHYITSIEITAFAASTRTVGATPVLVTSTNITGAPVWSMGNAAYAQGTIDRYQQIQATALKTTTANTATTIVCPATTSVIWRVNVTYFIAP